MSVKKLSEEIQAIICSSNNFSSYKKAVEELVYNSLDAKATSIAIRVHIQESKIQVVDNGCGITKKDSILLGQRYTTSKYVDLSTFKCAPNTYGYRGHSLSSIVEISKKVNITSRFENTDETWTKTFYKGKEQNLVLKDMRPSIGTTVEIIGFLYNLTIQNKNINTVQELHDIKNFLEQLSLVHSKISITLRDDSENELIFKMHKNRDIYQKFKILFDIERTDIQELHVEKSEYKSVAYIGKTCEQITMQHWIFLNKKFINNRKLNKIVQCYFNKALQLPHKANLIKKHCENNEHAVTKKYLPFYVIFLSCPYYDYDISHTPKQSILEFKNWKQINLLIEKLVKFYMGELKLKETKISVQEKSNSIHQTDIREKVQEIMKRILGSHSKKLGVSQMQNGVKGKLMKRKKKKTKNIIISKVLPLQEPYDHRKRSINNITFGKVAKVPVDAFKKSKREETKIPSLNISQDLKKIDNSVKELQQAITFQKHNIDKPNIKEKTNIMKKATKRKADLLIKAFEKPPEEVINRCNIIAHEAETAINFINKKKHTVIINEMVNYSNFIKNNKNISIRKRFEEIIIHDVIPLLPRKENIFTQNIQDIKKNHVRSSHDLLQTVLYTQPNLKSTPKPIRPNVDQDHKTINKAVPQLTYQSHHYDSNEIENHSSNRNDFIDQFKRNENSSPIIVIDQTKKDRKFHFTSKLSEDNFAVQKSYKSSKTLKKKKLKTNQNNKLHYKNINTFHETIPINQTDVINDTVNSSSYKNIAATKYGQNEYNEKYYTKNAEEEYVSRNSLNNNDLNTSHIGFTYTITSSNIRMDSGNRLYENVKYNTKNRKDYCEKKALYYCETQNVVTNVEDTSNAVFVSKSQNPNDSNNCAVGINPIDVCETIITSPNILDDNEVLNRNILNDSLYNFSLLVSEKHKQVQSKNLDFQSNYPSRRDFSSVCDILTDLDIHDEEINHESNKNNFINSVKNAINIERKCGEIYNKDQVCSCEPVDNLPKSYYINQDNVEQVELAPKFHLNQDNLVHISTSPCPNNDIIETNNSEEKNQECTENIHEIQMESCKFIQNIENEVNYNTIESIYFNSENDITANHDKESLSTNTFNLRNRLRFLPKGMSPLFVNCNSKSICDYNLEKEYFENELYNNFVSNVKTNTDVYEPRVQNTKYTTTKDIEKFNSRVEKDNASLTFSVESLKEGKVLGQVDNKFITTVLKGQSDSISYLVMFDQHAVHERIRLEKNLSDYCNGYEWKSVTVNDVPLKLSKDEIMYLHNYREKFNRFGLQWTIIDSHVIKLQAIPLAILGQNPREVEKVITAVKNLISEEIRNIRTQKGCVSMYPKTIMDLVCNEACRYAIMFGDSLSKKECVDLLASLSSCKTPFQCAHGRPVMAVLMDVKSEAPKYQITTNHIFKLKENLIKACKSKEK